MDHVSKGKQEFNINIMETPISEPIVKITALEQTEGELQYVQTIPSNLALHALPILSSKPNGKIQWLLNPQQIIDQIINPYLGDVNSNIHFFIAADLGKANQLAVPIKDEKSQVTYPSFGEWLLADKEVAFFGQAIAILVTDENWKTQKLSRYLFDPKVQSQFISIESQDPPILNVEESIKKEDKTLFNTVAYQNNVPSYRSIDYISNLPGASDDINWDQFNGDENIKIIKGKHKVGAQYHFYMETQSAIATRNGNFVDIWASTQSAASVTGNCTSLVNKMPRDPNDSEPLRANISIPSIGGGFGGKEPQSKYVALIAAFCAVKLGKTVRCVLDRNTDMRMIGKRHAVLGKYKVAATKDGEIKAMEIIYNLDAGNNYDCSLPVMDLMLLTAENAYDVPQFVAKGRCYFSNKPTSTAFRSFGVVQSHQITEFAIQNVAEELGMNSAEFRQKNFFKFKPKSEEKEEDFPKTPYGQKLIACNLNNVWSGLMKRFNSKKVHDQVAEFNNKNNYKKRGYSVLPLKYGISFTTTKMNISRAYLNFTDDGKIIVRTLGVEMGQGLHTKLLQIASYAFKVSIKDIIIDTTATQWYGQDLGKYPGTGASTGTDLNGRAILQLREGFNQVLKTLIDDQELWKDYEKNNNRWYSPALYNDNQEIIKAEVDLWARVKTTIKPLEKDIIAEMTLQPFLSDVQHDTKQGTPFYYFNYAAAYSVVEVDCLTGEFEIIETEILYDAGVSINPGIDIGQIEGGFVQGVGYVSCEAIEYGKDGNLITDGTWTYKIPSTTEIPRQLNVTFFPQREDGEINTTKPAFDEDGASSRRHERKQSEQNIGAPPSYEEAVTETQSPVRSERVGQTSVAAAPPPPPTNNPNQAASDLSNSASPPNQQAEAFDEFDPRGSFSAAPTPAAVPTATAVPATAVPTASTNAEIDLLDALSDSFAIVPVTPEIPATEVDAPANSGAMPTFAANQPASNFGNQGFDDPFGDNPFKAVASTDSAPAVQHISTSMPTFQPATNQNDVAPQPPSASSETVTNFDFGNSFSANAHSAPNSTNSQFLPQEMSTQNQGSAYSQTTQPGIYGQQAQSSANMYSQPTQPSANPYGQPAQPGANAYDQVGQPSSNAYSQSVQPSVNLYSQAPQLGANPYSQPAQFNSGNLSRQGSLVPVSSQGAHQITNSPAVQNNNDFLSGLISEPGSKPAQTVTPTSTGALAIVPQPSKDKFELKSAVWADTLSRGLVNLNISGPKTNPLADIGVDFDALNRKEKRMEKPAPNAVTSTVTMGKAMGSGSGIGRSGATTLRPPANPMMGSSMGSMGMGMGMGMGGGPVGGMGMGGGYGGMNQQPMGMGMGMNNMGMNPGMGMNMGMGQRPQMQGMPGGYNPMMGSGGYSQQPYGGGYR